MKRYLTIQLNGTDHNPFHIMGLKQNPFPQLGHLAYMAGEQSLNKLGGDPIKDVQQIRDTLAEHVSDELIELCCQAFKPGEMVEFMVTFEDGIPS